MEDSSLNPPPGSLPFHTTPSTRFHVLHPPPLLLLTHTLTTLSHPPPSRNLETLSQSSPIHFIPSFPIFLTSRCAGPSATDLPSASAPAAALAASRYHYPYLLHTLRSAHAPAHPSQALASTKLQPASHTITSHRTC
ncbi:hypothetical protein CSAL01_08866 [Colletotrichum salicis]|uniref:Uncharacterized protein n=1 Tax=Colletotrichum salicis TaxID=1209931 RepID=A0A135TDZ0_9PEZI|nr:hypothetical protein CSAL01_08866 [Colletotrichum salicis]